MLESLRIKNIALIRNQSLELTKGLNVLTGETGAGKSLIIDSISLLIGEKADKSIITRGEKEAMVEAVFSTDEKVKEILNEFGLEDDDKLIITRKINLEGKNETRVNGSAITLSMLKRLSAPLMDLHGQFEHQNLLRVGSHLKILDAFGGKQLAEKLNEYRSSYEKYTSLVKEISTYEVDDMERARAIDLYAFQIEEIDNAAFYEGEEEELKAYRNQVLHAERIGDALEGASGLIQGNGYELSGVTDSVKKAASLLSNISTYYDKANPIIDRLNSAKIELDDIADTIQQMKDELYVDEDKARQNEERLDLLSSFKKKYGSDIAQINKYRQEIGQKYDNLVNSIEKVESLKKQLQETQDILLKNAKALSDERKKCAKTFEIKIKNELVDLGMKNASFVVSLEDLGLEKMTRDGFDKVEFMFSANLGEDVKPLKNVASGGEMSRFMLAVKNVTASIEGVGTLVFDEIDTGVSGSIALKLAQKLSSVSKMAQVICVTHLAQIASFGDTHFVIEKSEVDGRTLTSANKVEGKQRENEIARLISGNITEHSLSHASELLQNAQNFKQN